jgi:hypothetical protein
MDPLPYLAYMQSAYGEEAISELERVKESFRKVYDEEQRDLLDQYRSIACRDRGSGDDFILRMLDEEGWRSAYIPYGNYVIFAVRFGREFS